MNKELIQAIKLYYPLLSTLNEEGCESIIESYAYLAYNGILNLDQFQSMLSGLIKNQVLINNNNVISKGKEFNNYIAALFPVWQKLGVIK
jgi:hypothetical protein